MTTKPGSLFFLPGDRVGKFLAPHGEVKRNKASVRWDTKYEMRKAKA